MLETRIQSFNDARAKDYLSLMKEGLERIRAMVGELLAFARPTAETANVSIRDTFQSAFRLAEKTFLENRVDWELDIPDGLPTLVGKRNEFGQIALNLIINAAQATQGLPSPKVIVSARVESAAVPAPGLRADSGDGRRETTDANRTMDVARQRLVIRVKDNGCGIPESIQDSIFDIFFTTRETQGGSGIGLAMTRHLVASMGGHIAVESAVGQGATFILSFPLPDAEQRPVAN
ncbi:MAG: HAMP domain-containing sensor histidine kinase [Planctomycetota bacterium]